MKKIFCLTWILIFMLSANVFAEENLRIISVNGDGIVETSPDRATVSVGVVSRNKDASKVQSENARIATEIINSVVALGVERKNIRTGNYNFRQVFRTNDNGKRIFDGYEVTNTVTIIVDDIKIVGKVIDSALSHGANKIDSLQFGLRDKKNFQLEAIHDSAAVEENFETPIESGNLTCSASVHVEFEIN